MDESLYLGTVIVDELMIRSGPGLNFPAKSTSLTKNQKIKITSTQRDGDRIWGKHEYGWSCLMYKGERYIDYQRPPQIKRRSVAMGDESSDTISSSNSVVSGPTLSASEVQSIFDTIFSNSVNEGNKIKKSMRLFGLPFQFIEQADPRVENISSSVGRTFVQNIIMRAPVATIIPGKPIYLPGNKNKQGVAASLIQAGSGNFEELQSLLSNKASEVLRYYDFQCDYTSYMKYVNIMCRAAATFLELEDELDGVPLQRYDWRNYRWNADSYKTMTETMLSNAADTSVSFAKKMLTGLVDVIGTYGSKAVDYFAGTDLSSSYNQYSHRTTNNTDEEDAEMDAALQYANFVQFYIDPDGSNQESASNSTSTSKIQSMFDNGSDLVKELAFVANSGGIDTNDLQQFGDASIQTAADLLSNGGQLTSVFSRLFSLSSNVIKGENVIIPEIYQDSDYNKSYSLTVHLKAPYGNKYSFYMECVVPMLHLLALALPKQTTANTFGAPFLIKCYVEGVFSCDLGIVTGITVNKNVSPESWTNDGYPTEIDVTLEIKDLYSSLTMSPQNEPALFLANSSLVEYLATTCGLNLVQPQISMRIAFSVKAIQNAWSDIPSNVMSEVWNVAEKHLDAWTSLTGR